MEKITFSLGILLLIAIVLLCGQCGRSSDFAKKYNDTKIELDKVITNNKQLIERLGASTKEIERIARIAAAEHERIVELEKITGEQGKINSELTKYFDGTGIALEDAARAIADSGKAVEEIEKYYKRKSVK